MFPGDLKKLSLRTKIKLIVLNFFVKIAFFRFRPNIIAITGSMSKSTTVNFTFQLLRFLTASEEVVTNLDPKTGARHGIIGLKKKKKPFP